MNFSFLHLHHILVICNTVKKAQEVYEKLEEQTEVFLLHSRFMQKDRARLEQEIMRFSEDNVAVIIAIFPFAIEINLNP